MLTIIQLINGKANVKFSFFINISPGSFPNGIFILNKNNIPTITNITPITIKSLAK